MLKFLFGKSSNAPHRSADPAYPQSILDSYSPDSLRMMVRMYLEESLHNIASGATFSEQAFTLIEWAERQTRVLELVQAAQKANPNNDAIQTLVKDVLRWFATPSKISFDWVSIPDGEFLMGSDKQRDKLATDDETPQHNVILPAYRILRTPVTVTQFAIFVESTGYKSTAHIQGSAGVFTGKLWEDIKGANWAHPRGPQSNVIQKVDHPVTCVSWLDAQAFCRWASEQTGQRIRSPNEAEWEKAARGNDRRIWPWCSDQPTDKRCNFRHYVDDTTSVDRYPEGSSPYGVLDMAGNVWEWTQSLYKTYPYKMTTGVRIRMLKVPARCAADRGMPTSAIYAAPSGATLTSYLSVGATMLVSG